MGSLSENEDIYEDLVVVSERKECDHENLLNDDGASSAHTEVPSDPWFEDDDLFPPCSLKKNNKCSSNNEVDDFTSFVTLQESVLKKKEIDLYNDLIVIENKEKRDEQNLDNELKELKKEVEKLRESDCLKTSRICELSAENANLKKNICSLYKTAKSEIEHKDSLLAEAHRKLDNFLFRKNGQNFSRGNFERNFVSERYRKQSDGQKPGDIQTDDRRGHPNDSRNYPDNRRNCPDVRRNYPDDRRNHIDDRRSHPDERSAYLGERRVSKRKRANDSPISSQPERELASTVKNSKNQDSTPLSHSSIRKSANCNALQRVASSNVSLQTPDTVKELGYTRDMTETNSIFFSLLPDPLKQSFNEYEQSQIVTLNKLKQAFVNQYFNCDTNIQTPTIQGTPKRSTTLTKLSLFNNSLQNTPSVNRASLPIQSTHRSNARNNFAQGDLPNNIYANLNVKIDTTKLTRNMQKDLGSLFLYCNERIPFLDKRKFGLLKNGKDLVPKCVL